MAYINLALSDYVLLLGSFINFFSSILVIRAGKKDSQNITFGFLLGFLSLYILSNFFIDYIDNSSLALLWVRVSSVSIILFSANLLIFSRLFLASTNKITYIKFGLVYAFALALSILSFTSLTIVDIDKTVYPAEVVKGNFYYSIIISVLFLTLLSLWIIFKKYQSATRLKKYQIKYLLTGIILSLIIASFTNIVLPLFGVNAYSRIGPSAMIIFGGMGAYALVNTALVDLRILLIKQAYFIFFLLIYYAFYSQMYIFLDSKYNSLYAPNPLIISLFLSALGLIVFKYLLVLQEKIIITFDHTRKFDILNEINKVLTQKLTLDEVRDKVDLELKKTFQSIKVKTVLTGEEGFASTIGTDVVSYDSLLISKNHEEQLDEVHKRNIEILEKYHASIIVPLKLDNEIIGQIIFDNKTIQAPYTLNEISYMEDIAKVISIGLKRIMLLEEVSGFNKVLEKRVNEATAELQEKYRQEKDMVGIIGHELRTPLTTAKGIGQLALNKAKNIQDQTLRNEMQHKLETVNNSILHAANLLETMLSTSHVENNQFNLQITEVNVKEIIEEIITNHTKQTKEKNVSLSFEAPSFQVPNLITDEQRVREVINNLVGNAIKYTRKGEVKVAIDKTDKELLVHVKDSGIGIPQVEIKNLGKRFYRVGQHLDYKGEIVRPGGTGLGLYVVKGILNALHGELRIESIEGVGSTFTAIFPLGNTFPDAQIKSENNEEEEVDLFVKMGLSKR